MAKNAPTSKRTAKTTKAAASKSKTDGAPKKAAKKVANTTSAVAEKKRPAANTKLAANYRPTDDEQFMSDRQRAYFREKLLTWKEDITRQTRETLDGLHEVSEQHADSADRATDETDRALVLRARDRQRKLISKIDAAVSRIDAGTYGYCEETGEPIGLKRLSARPIATLSLEAQERHERRERVYRND